MNKRVLIFGSYVTDLCVRTHAFPKAGETVKGQTFQMGPGGKGSNQAVAAKRAGADVTLVTKLGNDPLGKQALAFYEREGLEGEGILIDREVQTGAAVILVDEASAQNRIVVVSGACAHFTEGDLSEILKRVERTDLLLLQLETNLEPVKAILKHARKHGVLTVLNPAPAQELEEEYFGSVDIITPNETEACSLTGVKVADAGSAREAAKRLMERGVRKVVITLGGGGAYACDGQREKLFGIVDCGTVVDTTGAGDAFSGGLVAALARDMDFFDAVAYGSCVAGIAVTRHGTAPAMPYQEEIDRLYEKQSWREKDGVC